MSSGSFRERLSALSRGELIAVALVVVVSLAGAGLWYARSLPRPVEVRASSGGPAVVNPTATASASSSASPAPAVLLVDVAGWVRHPGVYEFHEGDRVIDALDAAGGPKHGAGLDGLNLAAPLADGTQILVPSATGVGAGTPGSPGVAVSPGAPAQVNINIASATELETLPGVGEVIAQRIVDYRTQNGPFASVDDLLNVSGIGDATLAEMRDMVTV